MVQSVDRAFLILRTLALEPDGLGITDVATRVGLPKSTVARLLSALEEADAVERRGRPPRWRPGPGLVALGPGSEAVANLVPLARPHLVELTAAVAEDAGLGVPEGYFVHYVAQVQSDNAVQVRDWTGERIPMHAVSSGLVLLAAWPAEAVERYAAAGLERFTAHTIIAPDTLRRRLDRTRAGGHAWVDEEYAEGINSVAAPVRDSRGRVVAALHAHGPSYRFPGRGKREVVAGAVMAAAARLSAQLGFAPPR